MKIWFQVKVDFSAVLLLILLWMTKLFSHVIRAYDPIGVLVPDMKRYEMIVLQSEA